VRAIVYTGTGGREVMGFEERPDPAPGSAELLFAVRFAALNTADLAQRAGAYPAPPGAPQDIPWLEVAGTVVAAGAAARDFAEGDRIFGLVGGGGLADRVVVHARHVTRVPDGLSDEEAAAIPEAFITSHDALVTRGGVRLGDLLLVNGASGGVGSASVQIGVVAGARVFASARSAHERLAELGVEPVLPDDAFPAVKRTTIHGTVLRARPLEEKAEAVQRFAHEVVPHLASGRMRAIIDRVFPAEDAADAFDHMAGTGKFGKVLLAF
jgi:NADPH:quinone reductase-like Zn-dependent oxidoreductase